MSRPSELSLSERLVDGLARLGLRASPKQEEALLRYVALLARWNDVYNLTAIRSPDDMLTHHVLDCLAAVAPLQRELGAVADRRLIDVGSGAGLPGIVFGVMDGGLDVLCVDSVGKKVAFMQQVIGELRLANVRAEHSRIEALRATASVIGARAYGSLERLASTTEHLLAEGGLWVAMKGKIPSAEIQAVQGRVDVFHVEPLRIPGLDEERCLVWMRRIAHSPKHPPLA